MNRFLCRIFVKRYNDTWDSAVRENYGRFAGITGIISNTMLCIAKIIAGVMSGSVSIIADSINNLTDASSSVITFIGFKAASRPGDRKHPYGHARSEYIAGIIVAMLVVLAGFELLQSAVKKIIHPAEIDADAVVIIILAVSIGIKIWQASFNMYVGKTIDSLTLKAAGADSRNDVISTSAVLICILISKYTGFNTDGYAGTAVALFILVSGINLLKETISPLLGEAPDKDLVNKICEIALSHKEVAGVHDLLIHNYGPGRTFASMHLEVDTNNDLNLAHELTDKIEYDIEKQLNVEITAHVDPVISKDSIEKGLSLLAEKIGEGLKGIYHIHDMRIIPDDDITHIVFSVILTSECKYTLEEIRECFDSEFKKIDKSYCVTIKFDRDYSAEMK